MKEVNSPGKEKRHPAKGILLLLISVGAGAAGVYYSQQYIDNQVALHTAEKPAEQVRQVSVVVPVRNLSRGDVIHETDLQLRQVPIQFVDPNTVREDNYQNALGQRVDFNAEKGKPLLWAHLAGGQTPTFSGKVEPGQRAMTVRVDEINAISGFLQPGDKVDLLMSHGKSDNQRIVPLMEMLNVIATGVQTEADKSSNGAPRNFSTITVHVTPADAKRLTLAQQVGKLTAILRNPEDEIEVAEQPLSIAQLLAGDNPVPATRRSVRVAKASVAPKIQYIIGGQ